MPLFCASCMKLCATSFSCVERLRGLDHELHRQAAAPGNGGGWNTAARTPAMLFRSFCITGCKSFEVRLRSIPRLQHHAGDRLPGRIQLEYVVRFRITVEDLIDLLCVHQALLQRGIRRGGEQAQ